MAAPQQNAIPLPPASTLPLPHAPQNPPNDDDFAAAIQYQEEITAKKPQTPYVKHTPTQTEYLQGSPMAVMHGAPGWAVEMLAHVDRRLDDIGTRLDDIGTRLDDIGTRLDDIDNLLYEYGLETGERLESLKRSVEENDTRSAKPIMRQWPADSQLLLKKCDFQMVISPASLRAFQYSRASRSSTRLQTTSVATIVSSIILALSFPIS
ncbi:hypothetical protein D9615_008736 [Tricholomella constricta]|uniref:Uncharacterized protein n=1 Tax=Tricholomella constricta TaxID=117010 RepID=A0A8H5H7L4_9AGAR|nr:hypothetical protein D9615_008736 [Tricholomella constricta]